MGGNLGANIDLGCVPADQALSNAKALYSESAGRFIVTVDPKKKEAFEARMGGLDYACIGTVTDDEFFAVAGIEGGEIIKEKIADLRSAWKEPFGDLV
jgi:phosphoribosylformylglycinamidine synthase